MSNANYQIDKTDREILRRLVKDARTPYLEIARELRVAGGTIHQRIGRMEEAGIIRGSRFVLDPEFLGYSVVAFIGVHLNRAQDCASVVRSLQKVPQVLEAHFTTGTYALMVKATCRDMQDYYKFLVNDLQAIEGVRSTESFLCMASPIARDIQP